MINLLLCILLSFGAGYAICLKFHKSKEETTKSISSSRLRNLSISSPIKVTVKPQIKIEHVEEKQQRNNIISKHKMQKQVQEEKVLERQSQPTASSSSNRKKKNKKKKKQQKRLQEIKQQEQLREQIESSEAFMTSSRLRLINSQQMNEQMLNDFIIDELELIENYFMEELETIIPYNGKAGNYRLNLQGSTKFMVLSWNYSEQSQQQSYPRDPLEISYHCDNLNLMEQQKIGAIYEHHKQKLRKQQSNYNYIFNVCTSIYQDFLMGIVEYQENATITNTQLEQLSREGPLPQTERNMEHEKEMYGRLLEEIFYMQDIKQKPNESLFINNPVEQSQKKYHSRGRYVNEFDELEMVGEGGFGKVYKARNKLDSNTYAIKKIIINYSNSSDRKLLKQVALLSKLNHPNIVRYHQSWLQDANSISELISDMSLDQTEDQQDLKMMYEDWKKSKRGDGIMFMEDSKSNRKMNRSNRILTESEQDSSGSSDGIMFEYEDEDDDGGIEFEDECSEIEFKNSYSENKTNNRKISFPKIESDHHMSEQQLSEEKPEFPFKILYIVMQFCQGINLKEFIVNNFKEDNLKVQIIRGILQGLAYIHERKIIHRDLKPANIFLTENYKVKIGDFGLATTGTYEERVNYELQDKSSNTNNQFQKTVGIGTAFYRSPEQIKSTKYDEKVDIFSLGIIIFEMFYEFSTYSERHKILSEITKTFRLPKDFNLYGHITDYEINIQSCINESPENRPSARKLLQNFRNKYFVLLVSAIANPKYTQFYELIKHLFKISNERRTAALKKSYFRSFKFEELLRVYKRHRGNMFSTLPLILCNDTKQLNGMKIATSRKEKYLLMSQQGVLMQYCSNIYSPWIFYAKQAMKRKREEQMRRFTFEKVIDAQHGSNSQGQIFREKYVTGFDICYDAEYGFVPFYLLEMLILSVSAVSTLSLTQQNPPLYLCHSKLFVIISKAYKIPLVKLYSCLLGTSEQKMFSLTETKKLEYFQKYQIEGNNARQLCELLEQSYETYHELIDALAIPNIKDFSEYHEIVEQFDSMETLNKYFHLEDIEYKFQIPPNNANGIFWHIGPLKGFTSIEEYTAGSQLCNINVEMSLPNGETPCDISIWSNQEFLENEIMQLISKCWEAGVSARYYTEAYGEKDESSNMNIIVRKKRDKKSDRIYYNIRKNDISRRSEEGKETSIVLKEHFDYEVFRQITQAHLSNVACGLNQRKSDPMANSNGEK